MKVTLIQTDIVWGKPFDNQKNVEKLLSEAPNSDLYVLPEMWSTGFVTKPEGMAEREEDSYRCGSLHWMLEAARKFDAAICGSIAVQTDSGKYVNRLYFVRPDGTAEHYDKRHLFSPGGEDAGYTAGRRRVVANFRGARFMLLVCYDLRFPVWSRNCGEYDAIIYVANWPEPRQHVWRTLLEARAIENQCYVAGANRTGNDPQCRYGGGSEIVSPYGKALAECDSATGVCTADIDIDALNRFRNKFRVLSDMDKFRLTE